MSFRAKLFFAALSAAFIALAVAGVLFADSMRQRTDRRIESTLVAETRLAAELLSRDTAVVTAPQLNDEAHRMGGLLSPRGTLICPDRPGVGGAAQTPEAPPPPQNHPTR